MAIKSVQFDSAFQIALDWVAGVRRIIVYSRPAGAGPMDGAALLDAMARNQLQGLCSGVEYGPETQHFSYAPIGMNAEWIDIYACDLGMDGELVRHECAGRFFNGSCRVAYEVRRIPVSSRLEAIRLTVRNRSGFDLEAGSIGYAVAGHVYGIPVPLQRNEEKELPQFEVPTGTPVAIRPVEGGYPVQARLREPGKSGRGE